MNSRQGAARKPRTFLRVLILMLLIALLLPFAFSGWVDLYRGFLERNPPVIEISSLPRGVGLAPVSLTLILKDDNAGLDEVVVRVRQRNNVKELLRQRLGGRKEASITIDFPGAQSELAEGVAHLEIRVFDRSLWSNQAELTLPLKVDYRRPRVEVITTQHNARQGGSQLVFYTAHDDNLAFSGVKVGNQTFPGFPASGIDPALTDPNLFVALYAIDQTRQVQTRDVRVFAEDEVGNAASQSFYNRILARQTRRARVPLTEEFLQGTVVNLAKENYAKLLSGFTDSESEKLDEVSHDKEKRLLRQFSQVNETLRSINNNEIVSLLPSFRSEKYWQGHFDQHLGTPQLVFGDLIEYLFEGKKIGEQLNHGYEIQVTPQRSNVHATNAGIVAFSRDMGVFGRTIAIDHGLGLVSLYGRLNHVEVNERDHVRSGQLIGSAGRTGLSRNLHLYYEMRVHGVPVDPREWWDRSWVYSHISEKINEVKRHYGIPVLRPVR